VGGVRSRKGVGRQQAARGGARGEAGVSEANGG
jgi:hypothetical protein